MTATPFPFRRHRWTTLVSAACLLLVSQITPAHDSAMPGFEGAPQPATADDMRIMAPYIGRFRSPNSTFDDGETDYHFEVEYRWFDNDQTIVKYTVTMVIPAQQRRLVNSEGFYGYDPANGQIYVFGAFTRGITGWGTIGRFDHDSGTRAVWATSVDGDGVRTRVRDEFEPSADGWKNRTLLWTETDPEWRQVYEAEYQRVDEGSG